MALGDLEMPFKDVSEAPACAESTLERLVLHFKHEDMRAAFGHGASRPLLSVDQVTALYVAPP